MIGNKPGMVGFNKLFWKNDTMLREFKSHTIWRRLIILSGATLGFFVMLAITFAWNIASLKSDVVAIEDFYNLFNNVLELRRYEKNYLFGVGSDNFQRITFYLDSIEKDTHHLSDGIIKTVGKLDFLNFRQNLLAYRAFINKKEGGDAIDVATISHLGKTIVDFTQDILTSRRTQIHAAFNKTLFGFMMATGSIFTFIFLFIHFQVVSVLLRLASLQKATQKVANGDFTPININSGKPDEISSLIQDFNKMVAEIENRQEQLVRSRRLAAIGTFSSGIAHELNNPLNNISLTADALQEEYDTLDQDEAKEMIADIILQTDRASSVVKNLLDFCRRTPPVQERLNIKEVVEGTAKLIRNQLRLESIWLEDYIPATLPVIRGDKKEMQQVFLNLFLNSIHAISSGGGLIHIDGKMGPPGYIRVDFNDTGRGIAEEKLEHIFDPFYTDKPVGQGTGLGLSIVYGIIKKHGGYIEVRSKVNVGTTFSIFLPIAESPEPTGSSNG